MIARRIARPLSAEAVAEKREKTYERANVGRWNLGVSSTRRKEEAVEERGRDGRIA